MAKRDAIYAGEEYFSPYPRQEEMVHKKCDICGDDMVVNNWADKKSRTPKFKDFVICVNCDPRSVQTRYQKEGHVIMWPRRLRIVNMARIVRALARGECLRVMKGETIVPVNGCNCAACAARKLFPNG